MFTSILRYVPFLKEVEKESDIIIVKVNEGKYWIESTFVAKEELEIILYKYGCTNMSNKRTSKNLIIWYNTYKGARYNGFKSFEY